MKRSYRLIGFAAGLASIAPALAKDDYAYGPPPDWTRYKALGDAAVRAKLPDPDHWAVEWPNGYVKSGWRHKGRFVGYLSCGRLRATAPVGGGYPVVNFVAVIDYDQVKTIDISSRESNSLVNVMCNALITRGYLAPAELMDRPRDLELSTVGMTIRPMPEGAYVVAATPVSRAGQAGLTPGMVVRSVNGVDLSGLGPAMGKLLDVNKDLTIETTTGMHLVIARKP